MWVPPSPKENKDSPTTADSQSRATAAQKPGPAIHMDPLQEGKICLYSWQLYTPEAPVLDLHNTRVTSHDNLQEAFLKLYLCPEDNQYKHSQCTHGRKKIQKKQKIKVRCHQFWTHQMNKWLTLDLEHQ